MTLVHILIDKDLLRAIDDAARAARVSRSAFISEALRSYLVASAIATKDEQDRAGYSRLGEDPDDALWEMEQVWLED